MLDVGNVFLIGNFLSKNR